MADVVIILKDAQDISSGSKTQRKLKQILSRVGYDVTNIMLTRSATADKTIEKHNPNVVITMGLEALKSVYTVEKTLGAYRGELLKTHSGHKLIPTFHPGFIQQNWQNQEVIEYDFRKAALVAKDKKWPLMLPDEYTVVSTIKELKALRDYLATAKRFSWDIETEGFDTFNKDEILCLQFSTQPGEGIVVPLRGAWGRHDEDVYTDEQLENAFPRFIEDEDGKVTKLLCKNEKGKPQPIKPAFKTGDVICQTPEIHVNGKKPTSHLCRGTLTNVWGGPLTKYVGPGRMHGKMLPDKLIRVLNILSEILSSPVPKIAYNGKFDCHGMEQQYGIQTHGFLYDGMLAFHQFHEERPTGLGFKLEFVRNRYTFMPKYDDELHSYLPKGKRGSFAMVPNEVLWEYGAYDADCEFRVLSPLLKEIEADNPENGLWLYQNIDMPYNRAIVQMENNGMLIDPARFDTLCEFYNGAITQISTELDVMCQEHGLDVVEWSNPYRLRPFLFERNYEVITRKAKYGVCKECKRKVEGCKACDGHGKALIEGEITRPMTGIGFPTWGVPKTAKTDDEKTDKKAFQALRRWCNETVIYTLKIIHDKPVRKPTGKLMSEKELKQRRWKLELLRLIEEFKGAIKARNSFLAGDPDKYGIHKDGAQAMLQHIRIDGRIHSSYLQLTKTARVSSSEPNLENIKNDEEPEDEWGNPNRFYGYGIRTMFTVPKDCAFLEADYNAQEMRILAELADENNLRDVFFVCPECKEDFRATEEDPERPFRFRPHQQLTGHKAQDLHKGTAAKVFKLEYDSVQKNHRTFAKRVNFGINYRQSSKGLGEVLGISMSEAQDLIDEYKATFPGIEDFQDGMDALVWKGAKIPNGYGRWRHNYGVKEMKHFSDAFDYKTRVERMTRQCTNYPIQSTPADIAGNIAIALGDVWGIEYEDWKSIEAHVLAYEICGGIHPATALRDMGCLLLNLVHDSAQFEVPISNLKEAANMIELVMVRVPWLQLNWWLPVDLKAGHYWGDPVDLLQIT